MKITTVSHVRSLSGLELQAVEMTLDEEPLSALNGSGDLTFALGVENGIPFVGISRDGSKREVLIHFENKHKTADERRKDDRKSGVSVRKSPAKPKPVAAKK